MRNYLYPVILLLLILSQSCLSTNKLTNCTNFKHKAKNKNKWAKLEKRNSSKKTNNFVFKKKRLHKRIINKLVTKKINKILKSNNNAGFDKGKLELFETQNRMRSTELLKLNIESLELASTSSYWHSEKQKSSNPIKKHNKARKSYEQKLKNNKFILKKDSITKITNSNEKKIIGFGVGSIGLYILLFLSALLVESAGFLVIVVPLSLLFAIISLCKLKKYNFTRKNKGLPKFRLTSLIKKLTVLAIIVSSFLLVFGTIVIIAFSRW